MSAEMVFWWSWWLDVDEDAQLRADLAEAVAWFLAVAR